MNDAINRLLDTARTLNALAELHLALARQLATIPPTDIVMRPEAENAGSTSGENVAGGPLDS
jgi:hypothetical protein